MRTKLFLIFISLLIHASAYGFTYLGLEYTINSDGTSVTLSDGQSFNGDLTIPASVPYGNRSYTVTVIGRAAFWSCTGLKSVNIPYSVTEIKDDAFEVCKNMTSVIIQDSGDVPSRLETIGQDAFASCHKLTSVNIPKSVTSIGANAFTNCYKLNAVHITDLVAWCNISFNGLYSNPLRHAHNLYLNGSLIRELVIPSSVTKIKYLAFYGCSCLTSVTIPLSVKSIGAYAFVGCSGLTSVMIPRKVTSIGAYAFSNCSGLTSMIVENENSKYDSRDNCNAIIETGTNKLLFGCQNTTILNSVTSIGDGAFEGCTGLTSVIIPNSVESIGSYAFSNCSGLTSLIVENGNSKYDSRSNCNAIIETETNKLLFGCQNTTIPNSVILIEKRAFDGCSGLTSITIPSSVTFIDNYAFRGCTGLSSIKSEIILSTNSIIRISIIRNVLGEDVFSYVDKNNCILYVPEGQANTYRNAEQWSDFVNIEEIPSVYGDVNGDGEVTTIDITCLYNYLLNGDETYLATSDVDGDGEITTVDITVIYNILLGN